MQHAPSCTDFACPSLSPSLPGISELLSSGHIPVLTYSGSSLMIHRAEDCPYVAVSHVWVDGLGSTTEGGLPTCQVARISAIVSELIPGGAFWIDSLCVPGSDRELRKSAIRLMAQTYRGANAVVVLDAQLRQLSARSTPMKEITVRIALSAWMQRIWTVQEGMLARELYFELSDELFDLKRVGDAITESNALVPSSLGLFHREPLLEYHIPPTILLLSSPDRVRRYSLREMVILLKKRTTSKPEDETIAIAGLLGVDVGRLLKAEEAAARMRMLFLELETVPAHVVFKDGPKLNLPGFRWAPHTLTTL
ncbi:hypothetical protein C8Q74DRAFT_1202368, partial [Fomes fomentarius]